MARLLFDDRPPVRIRLGALSSGKHGKCDHAPRQREGPPQHDDGAVQDGRDKVPDMVGSRCIARRLPTRRLVCLLQCANGLVTLLGVCNGFVFTRLAGCDAGEGRVLINLAVFVLRCGDSAAQDGRHVQRGLLLVDERAPVHQARRRGPCWCHSWDSSQQSAVLPCLCLGVMCEKTRKRPALSSQGHLGRSATDDTQSAGW